MHGCTEAGLHSVLFLMQACHKVIACSGRAQMGGYEGACVGTSAMHRLGPCRFMAIVFRHSMLLGRYCQKFSEFPPTAKPGVLDKSCMGPITGFLNSKSVGASILEYCFHTSIEQLNMLLLLLLLLLLLREV